MAMSEIEKRSFTEKPEIRAEGSGRLVEGYALVFNSESKNLGGFTEIIDPGALEGADLTDVRARTNHNDDYLLARTTSGTLKLSVDSRGLKYSFEAPNTTAGNDLIEMLKRGDIDGSSFAFHIDDEKWEDRGNMVPLRRITKFKRIVDVAPVVDPAYNDTSVAKRSMEQSLTKPEPPPKEEHIYDVEERIRFYKIKYK